MKMTTAGDHSTNQKPGFVQRLRNAGIEPQDSEELRIRKSILMFAMGLMTAAPMFWLALYRLFGPELSATLPLTYQLASVATLLIYAATGSFSFFKYSQLTLFLFFPFVAQLLLGNFITASGLVLWGILAPVVAVLVLGSRASIPWFIGYVVLVFVCGFVDLQLAGTVAPSPQVPLRTSVIFFMLNFAAVSSLSYFLLRYAAVRKETYEAKLHETNEMLQREQQRSEKLLLNILPERVAERLKKQDQPIADGFADVTVMFADIVNFTQIAAGMSPAQIFAMLNKVFSGFDELAEQHGLEKIKTIGDAYMAAGGLDGTGRSDYTEAVADLALAMQKRLARDRTINDIGLQIRMGIGTGPVVAGVVGKKKFIYDLWGDTVNLASRITSEGGPGAIHVDATTYLRLRGKFAFNPPQTVYLKGKGETVVHPLVGRQADVVHGPAAPEAA